MRLLLLLLPLTCLGQKNPVAKRMYEVFVANGVDTLSAKILVAQASFESGYFKNPLTKLSKNPFALLHNPQRKTLAYNGKGQAEGRTGYAQFKSLDDATLDFIYFLDYRGIPHPRNIVSHAVKLKKKRYYGSSCELYSYGILVHFKHHFG